MTETELSIIRRIQNSFISLEQNYKITSCKKEFLELLLQKPGFKSQLLSFLIDLSLIFRQPKKVLGITYRKNELFATPETLELSPILPSTLSFLYTLISIIEKPSVKEILNFDLITESIKGINMWNATKQGKIDPFEKGNWFLQNSPNTESSNTFYARVRELNPKTTLKCKHPFNETQIAIQRKRSTREILAEDTVDPISGARFFRPRDSGEAPGSGILVATGHHRLYELYRRYLQGELTGDELVLFRRIY